MKISEIIASPPFLCFYFELNWAAKTHHTLSWRWIWLISIVIEWILSKDQRGENLIWWPHCSPVSVLSEFNLTWIKMAVLNCLPAVCSRNIRRKKQTSDRFTAQYKTVLRFPLQLQLISGGASLAAVSKGDSWEPHAVLLQANGQQAISPPNAHTHTHSINQPVTPGVSHSPGQEPAPQLSLSAVL